MNRQREIEAAHAVVAARLGLPWPPPRPLPPVLNVQVMHEATMAYIMPSSMHEITRLLTQSAELAKRL